MGRSLPARHARGMKPTQLLTAVRARWFHGGLDADLASGRDPWSSAALTTRAGILVSHEQRRQIAVSLLGLVRLAELGHGEAGFLRIRLAAVLEEREALLALGARLHAAPPVPVTVVARLAVLVGDDSSPIYDGGRPVEELAVALRACEAELLVPVQMGP
jgi:hypothetical protein